MDVKDGVLPKTWEIQRHTLGGARAFLNFSAALAEVISRVTTPACLEVKDCTDQGLYNLLVYLRWEVPHTRTAPLPPIP